MGVICFKIKYVFFRLVCFGFFTAQLVLIQSSTADMYRPESLGERSINQEAKGVTGSSSKDEKASDISDKTIPRQNIDKNTLKLPRKDAQGLMPARLHEKVGSPLKPVMIYGIHTDFRLTVGGQTQYNTLFSDLAADGLEFRMRIRSMRRSLRSFAKNTSSCIFPSNIKLINTARAGSLPKDLIVSDAVDTFGIKVFTAHNQSVFTSLDELNEKRVAYWGKSMLAPMLERLRIVEEPTHNESVRLKMLSAGRVDAIIAPDKDVFITAKALGMPRPNADPNLIIWGELSSSLVCQDSPKTRVFMAEFESRLAHHKSSRRLEAILDVASTPIVE